MRMGQADEAIAAGKQLLAGSGGALESFKFYADLCGQVGRIDERLDTLRRCLRVNPRSKDAQEMLASRLAEDFKTEQAIELYWNMLDSADAIEGRREVVNKLADLYLRSNRLDQLVSRLEIRGRESGDRRATIDLVATAHEQAGDLGLAREALEGGSLRRHCSPENDAAIPVRWTASRRSAPSAPRRTDKAPEH